MSTAIDTGTPTDVAPAPASTSRERITPPQFVPGSRRTDTCKCGREYASELLDPAYLDRQPPGSRWARALLEAHPAGRVPAECPRCTRLTIRELADDAGMSRPPHFDGGPTVQKAAPELKRPMRRAMDDWTL